MIKTLNDTIRDMTKSTKKLFMIGGNLNDETLLDEINCICGHVATIDLSIIPVDSIGSAKSMVVTVNQQVDDMYDALENDWDLDHLDIQVVIRGHIYNIQWDTNVFESLHLMAQQQLEHYEYQLEAKRNVDKTVNK